MEGMAPFFVERLRQTRARTIHQHIERGINLRRLQRDVRYGRRRVLEPGVADELPFAIVALSGSGAVTSAQQLESNLYWLRAAYPKALIAWLGHTVTRTRDAEADEERARAAELEAQLVPSTLDDFLWVDMRLEDAPLAPDGLHHTRAGYRQLVDHAWAQIIAGTTALRSRSWAPALFGGVVLGLAATLGYRALERREHKQREYSEGEGGPWR